LFGKGGAPTYLDTVKALFGSSLIAYWPMNETDGTTTVDRSGNGRNGSYTSVTLANADAPTKLGGKAPKFDGTNSYCSIAGASLNAAFSPAEGSFSIWGKVTNESVWNMAILALMTSFVDANNRVVLRKHAAAGSIGCVYSAGGTAEVIAKATTTLAWFHIAMTWSVSEDKAILYFNGSPVSESSALGTWVGSTTVHLIGAYSATPDLGWNGWLCHSMMLSKAASSSEITSIYNLGV
jgi:hypothetical protein